MDRLPIIRTVHNFFYLLVYYVLTYCSDECHMRFKVLAMMLTKFQFCRILRHVDWQLITDVSEKGNVTIIRLVGFILITETLLSSGTPVTIYKYSRCTISGD